MLTMLTIASILDLKTRKVSNKVFLIFLPFAIILSTYKSLLLDLSFYTVILSNTYTLKIVFFNFFNFFVPIIFYFLNFYKGADFKGLFVLSLTYSSSQPLTSSITLFFAFIILLIIKIIFKFTRYKNVKEFPFFPCILTGYLIYLFLSFSK